MCFSNLLLSTVDGLFPILQWTFHPGAVRGQLRYWTSSVWPLDLQMLKIDGQSYGVEVVTSLERQYASSSQCEHGEIVEVFGKFDESWMLLEVQRRC